MDDLPVSLAVVVLTGIVVAAILFFTNRAGKEKATAIQEMASSHGWQYTPITERLAWGTKLAGKNWELVARSESIGQSSDSGSSNIQSKTIWSGIWIKPLDVKLLIGPGNSSNTINNLFIPTEYAGLRQVNPGISELASNYIFLGSDENSFGFLRISTIPRQLLEWPDKQRPLIKISPTGVEIVINGFRYEKPEELERIIRLGESITSDIGL